MHKIGYWLLAIGCWLKTQLVRGFWFLVHGKIPQSAMPTAPFIREPRTLKFRKLVPFNKGDAAKRQGDSVNWTQLSTKILLFGITVSLCLPLTGCYDAREVDELGYVMAVGLDKGDPGFVKMTLQIAIPKNISGGGGEKSSGGGQESSLIAMVETHSIPIGLNNINTFLSRQLILADAKVIVFSSELAKEGLAPYLHSIIRSKDFRPTAFVAVSRTSAEEYIKNVAPKMETNPAKYYELNFNSYKYTGLFPATNIHSFYFDTESHEKQAIATLASVNKFGPDKDINLGGSTAKEKGQSITFLSDFKAGDIPRKSDLKSEIMGAAVFDGTKMVGELDGEESSFYLMTIGQYNYANWSFSDPKHTGRFFALNIKQGRKPNIKVRLVNGKPYIDIKIALEADILSIQSGENYEAPERIGEIENYASKKIKEGMMKLFEKCAREFHSDIFGFGSKAKYLVLTWKQWEAMHWLDIFKYSQFNTEVNLKIRRSGLIIRTIPEKQVQ